MTKRRESDADPRRSLGSHFEGSTDHRRLPRPEHGGHHASGQGREAGPAQHGFRPTTATYRSGSRTLPGELYTSPAVFAAEKERIFSRMWSCVGRTSSVGTTGEYVLRTVADESLIVLRDTKGKHRALFNVCRHRGTRLCRDESGRFDAGIQCPYHAWTYSTEGQLIGAPHMQEVEGFDRRDYPLHQAGVAEWEGFLFVNVGEAPAPFAEAWAIMLGRLARFGLPSLVIGHRARYEVRANWKLVFQNYSECLHCPVIHPQLAAKLPYQSGANDLTEGAFLGGSMEIAPPNESATSSGRAAGRLIAAGTVDAGQRHAYYYTLMPNLLLSIHPDYVNYYRIDPVAPDLTVIETEWLCHPDTLSDGGARLRDAIDFWEITNRQDWDIIERGQLGISSRRYVPGPYSPRESIPAAWDREYLRLME